MSRGIDVYQILRSFAERNKLKEIRYRIFAQAIQRQAKLSDQSEPLFRDLALNPDTVLVPKLFLLSKEHKLLLRTSGNEIDAIVLPERFLDAFLQEYRRIDENPDLPFPDEASVGLSVPGEWIQAISLDADLGPLAEARGKPAAPLYRLNFPEGAKPLVVPSAFVPEKLLEYAALKLRQYLRRGANKDFMFNKLVGAFPGKEGQLKEALSAVLTRPTEVIKGISGPDSDFAYPFWAYFLSAVKRDLEKLKDKTPEDAACCQSALLCEFFVNHYKARAQRLQELEAASRALDADLRKLPYYFTMDDIMAFRDGGGALLADKFGREEIEGRIREKCVKAEAGELPELLLISTEGSKFYAAKDKALLLVVRQIAEARPAVRGRMVEQWKRLLGDFRTAPAMDSDAAFLAELAAQVESRFPILNALVGDRLLPLVRDEAASKGELPPEVAAIFYKDSLVPLDELLGLSRKALLADARMLLPLWYSVPILASLARIIRRLAEGGARKAAARAAAAKEPEGGEAGKQKKGKRALTAKERRADFEAAAGKIAKDMLPPGRGLDEYLAELEGRWNSLLNPEAKRNLTYDVESLARDYLRGVLRTMGSNTFTTERLKNLGSNLADSPALMKIRNHQALEQFIQLYMVKVLSSRVRGD